MPELVLIVEDEKDLVSTLEYNLRKEGFQTRCAFTGADGLQALEITPLPDLVLLDLMLPDISGIEVCRRMRAAERYAGIPIVMLTARGEEIDRVIGFESGADDYVVKPFSVRELLLRIRAVLRRSHPSGPEEHPSCFGKIRIDPHAHRVFVDEEEIQLTALEFKLLATFLARKGQVQTRETLLNDVWAIDAPIVTRTVDTHIKRLREKLGPAGDYIETLRGVGYRFRASLENE
jgi:two-component system, OmpR family, phosphate regulon response regulator PhoB